MRIRGRGGRSGRGIASRRSAAALGKLKAVPAASVGDAAAQYDADASHQTVLQTHVAGDLLLILHAHENGGTPTLSGATGWTQYSTVSPSGSLRVTVFSKIAESNTEAAPLLTGAAVNTGSRCLRIRGVNTSDWDDGSNIAAGSQVNGINSFNGFTVNESKELALILGACTNWSSGNPAAAGWTLLFSDKLGATNAIQLWAFLQNDPAIGSLASGNVTSGNSGQWGNITVGIKAA